MRKIIEILRLYHEARLSRRQIAASLRLSRDVVSRTLERAERAGVGWPLEEGLDEAALERLLYPPASAYKGHKRPEPDWSEVHRELPRKGMTLQLIWQEYKTAHPDGFQYSWFCDRYRAWLERVDVVMRHHHRAGEKLFVDYAGQTVPVVDPETGQERPAQIFVAVLGASNYTYAEATWTQGLRDWIGSHVRAFTFFGGTPEIVVPDNLRSGISKAHRYEPEINPTYADLASHYGLAVLPARAGKPRDKAKVEVGVQIVERWILARLRTRTFLSLPDLNREICHLLRELNDKPFQKLPGSRRTTFEEIERGSLRPLPPLPYVFAEWRKARVNIDYHIELDGHYYSVPYRYARLNVDVRFTETTVECFYKGRRIASHARSLRRGRHTTVKQHMPASHQQYAEWSPDRLIDWAAKTGPATAELVRTILQSRPHVQQGYRSAFGVLRLGKSYGEDRLEAAARRALAIGASSYKSVESILKNGLDSQPLHRSAQATLPIAHENIRGALYFGPGLGPNSNQTDYEC